ncbi:MAG: response regulator [Leptospirales bacterium]
MKSKNPTILIAEDDPVNATYLSALLTQDGFDVEIAEDGELALAKYKEHPYDVVISDLNMPVMGGIALFEQLNKMESPPVMMVETVETDKTTIVEMMKHGVTDYFFKPIQSEEFLFKVHKAIEISKLRKAQHQMESERQDRLDHNLDWNILKERVVARSYDKFDKTLFTSLKSSFNQGAGLGSLITLVSMIQQTGKVEGDTFTVGAKYMDLLFKNAAIAQKSLQTISDIYSLLEKELDLEEVSVDDFYKELQTIVSELGKYIKIKSHRVLFNDADYSMVKSVLKIDIPNMKIAIRELLMNALKFSPPNSEIYMFTSASSSRFHISVMNQPDPSLLSPTLETKDYERLIFEPFYRLSNFVYEEYDTIDFGLGLTQVEKIVRKNKSTITVARVADKSHLDEKNTQYKISMEISIPLVEPEPEKESDAEKPVQV